MATHSAQLPSLAREPSEEAPRVHSEPPPRGGEEFAVSSIVAIRRTNVVELVGIAVTITAVLLAAFAAYVFGWSNLQASRDQRQLLSGYAASGEFPAFHGHTPPDGSLVAVLRIPAIGLRQAVVEGTTSTDLDSGPGLMPATAVPGSRGESVIAGRHGTFGSPFAHLSQLRPGDQISLVDFKGRYLYTVSSIRALGAGEGLHVGPTGKPLLVLVTSRSSLPPSGLEVVTSTLTGTPGSPAAASPPATKSELLLGGGLTSFWQLIGWALLLVAALVGVIVAYRRAGRPTLVYVLSTPVILLVALFTFENLSRLFPATM